MTGPSCSSGSEDKTDWLGKVSPTGSSRQQGSSGSPRHQGGACHSPKSPADKEAKPSLYNTSMYKDDLSSFPSKTWKHTLDLAKRKLTKANVNKDSLALNLHNMDKP